jgi:hypothetical protein
MEHGETQLAEGQCILRKGAHCVSQRDGREERAGERKRVIRLGAQGKFEIINSMFFIFCLLFLNPKFAIRNL